MNDARRTVVGLGELLWDLLPSGKQLGGAPANFAYITNLLGDAGFPASRVSWDSLGNEALERLAKLGVSTEFVQRDAFHATGTVKIIVDLSGQPSYEIPEPVAWDFLEWTPAWRQLAGKADAVCFGSLAQRSSASRDTIRSFLRATRPEAVRILDLNLRQHFYSGYILAESLSLASILKLNDQELPKLMNALGLESRPQHEAARHLLSLHNLKLVCVTRGGGGSLLVSPDESSEHPGFRVKVVDTVGAGDAFTAALVYGYLRGRPLSDINETANRVGAWVASQAGATPALNQGGGLSQALAQIA